MRGKEIVEKNRASPPSPPPKKTGKQFFSSKVVVTIRFYTLESVGNKLKILENNYCCGPMEFTPKFC
jgi:hypothetical protein